MSTDIYGLRVLDVDRDELRIRFRVFMVYYDTGSKTHPPVPDDPTFFFHALWEGGPLRELLSVDTVLDYAWVDANARRYVSRVERVATRNHPPTAKQWKALHDFYYERNGVWKDEDLLVQFDYDVWVTDPRWLELDAGASWATTFFPFNADTWTADDAPHLPNLAEPVVRQSPFAGRKGDFAHDHIDKLAFSDDGRYLAACSGQGHVWAYDTTDWSEAAHAYAGDWIVPMLMWVPGEHIVTVKCYERLDDDPRSQEQWAFDVRSRTETEVPFQAGHIRSRDGSCRISPNGADEGGYDLLPTASSPQRRISHAGEWDPIQCKVFSWDGSRLFLGAQQNLYVIDPATGTVVDKVVDASERLFELASSPDGSYLAVASFSRKLSYLGPYGGTRPHELCVWRTADKKIILGRQMETYIDALAWSPDGRWLVAALEPCDDKQFATGKTELVVFAMGPEDAVPS